MRVLLTGAAGFLGRIVARHLTDEGWSVTGFDRRPGTDLKLDWVVGDLTDAGCVREAAAGHQVICHLGGIGDVYLAAEDPAQAASANVVGSAHVAAAARTTGARVVYASTWEVYGDPHYEPIDEDHPCRPDHPYSITKLAGEQMLLAASELEGVPVLSLRIGTAYGPGMRPNSVFRVFIDRARRAEPITIQGDGSQSRQFTHAKDIARAFARACVSDLSGTALNCAAPESISIGRLAELIVARYPTDILFGEPRPGDVRTALISSDRAREQLGWKAEVPFDEGISHLLDEIPQE